MPHCPCQYLAKSFVDFLCIWDQGKLTKACPVWSFIPSTFSTWPHVDFPSSHILSVPLPATGPLHLQVPLPCSTLPLPPPGWCLYRLHISLKWTLLTKALSDVSFIKYSYTRWHSSRGKSYICFCDYLTKTYLSHWTLSSMRTGVKLIFGSHLYFLCLAYCLDKSFVEWMNKGMNEWMNKRRLSYVLCSRQLESLRKCPATMKDPTLPTWNQWGETWGLHAVLCSSARSLVPEPVRGHAGKGIIVESRGERAVAPPQLTGIGGTSVKEEELLKNEDYNKITNMLRNVREKKEKDRKSVV